MDYREKLKRTTKEARATLVALAAVVVVWLIGGYGLAGVDVTVFGTPLWVVCGLFGTWIAAIVAACVLSRCFEDFPLDDEEPGAREETGAGEAACSDERARRVLSEEDTIVNTTVTADGADVAPDGANGADVAPDEAGDAE